MEFERNELNQNSFGGTEQMMTRLYHSLPDELLSNYQIIASRVRELQGDKLRVLWSHDLPDDPEAVAAIKWNGAWTRFHRLVFVSHWQRQQFLNKYPEIHWSRTAVIANAIEPFARLAKPKEGPINIIYHTTPHRGLNILVPVFERLCEKYDNIHLDVYSSFGIYGWEDRDIPYKPLFDKIANHPKMTYHGSKSNEEIRTALQKAHIFAYPSIWPETSCLALIEAMSAGCICVHPDYAALPETSANWTFMYPWNEDMNRHAGNFYSAFEVAIQEATKLQKTDDYFDANLNAQMSYVNMFNNWDIKKKEWEAFLLSFANEPKDINNSFRYVEYHR